MVELTNHQAKCVHTIIERERIEGDIILSQPTIITEYKYHTANTILELHPYQW